MKNKTKFMDLSTENTSFNKIERYLHSLMLSSKYLKNIGLIDGKTGIAIAYAAAARRLSNEVYYDCMSDMLDDVLVQTNSKLDIGFTSGLSGIGWGIEYLIQNKFVEGEGADVCEELDNKIMETDLRRISDKTLEKGLEGLLHYIIFHLQGALKQNSRLPFDNSYLSDIYCICTSLMKQNDNAMLQSLLDIYCTFYKTGAIKNYNTTIFNFLPIITENYTTSILSCPLGLRNGLAGYILRTVTS